MKIKVLISTAVIVLMLFRAVEAGRPLAEKMQNVLDKNIRRHHVRGVSAAVVFPNGEIWTGVSGISHDSVAVKPDMLFAIGSITKNIVAALVLQLAEEGVLSLDDPLSKWLPKYAFVDSTITIRQLLNHTSGLYMFWDNQALWDALKRDRTKVWTPEEVLSYIKEPYFSRGEGWHYSNTNYLLAAMIVEKATGSKISSEFRKRFWQPLDFCQVFLAIEETIPDYQIHVYGDNFQFGSREMDLTFEPRASHDSITWGSAGIFITAEELARWSHALFQGKVLQQQSMEQMLQFVKFKPVANMRAYGLGVQRYTRNFAFGKDAIGHGGANIGSSTYMVYLPDYHISIVVMINAYPNSAVDAITKGLIRIVLKEQGAIGLIPYFEFFPAGFLMACIGIGLTCIIVALVRKRK
ncbi:beta-lactamase family protein [candidate division KSB1 bacterium]|nr:beta-lactamase family protein [candidate division KSB1 bacterium]